MIRFTIGDILSADAEALVNTVNCVGIMGRGIALQFKNAYPANFKAYEAACRRGEVQPGRMFVHETGFLHNPKYIINFPTKRHWRGNSRIEDIESGLVALAQEIRTRNIHFIAIPPLGSGLGGLNWGTVRQRIETELSSLADVDILVFEPASETVVSTLSVPRTAPHMTAGRAALIGLMNRYLGGLMDPFVTLLEVHKLMYFMQEAGEPLKLRYAKGPYGPYAENLSHVLKAIEGYYVTGYADGGDAPTKQLELIPGALPEADHMLRERAETRSRFDRVSELVEGFETPFGLELLATVHWVARREDAATPQQAIVKTYAWGERKRKFTERQIFLAYDVLMQANWLQPFGMSTTRP